MKRTWVKATSGTLLAALLVELMAAATAFAQPVPNNLPVGTCVTAYGNSGRIVDTVPNGYRIASDADPRGTPFVAPASSTTQSACKQTTPVQPSAAAAARGVGVTATPNAGAAPTQAPGTGCFASSSGTLSGQARTYANLIIGNWAAAARPGSDGAVTVKVDALRVGASRHATFYDRDNATLDPRAPVTPVVARVTLCTDFRTRLDMREVQENFLCYTKATGGLSCGETAHTGDLPQPRDWSVDK